MLAACGEGHKTDCAQSFAAEKPFAVAGERQVFLDQPRRPRIYGNEPDFTALPSDPEVPCFSHVLETVDRWGEPADDLHRAAGRHFHRILLRKHDQMACARVLEEFQLVQ